MTNLKLKAGDCFLVHSHDWLAKAIDAVEAFWDFGNRRLYSHAGIIVQDNGLTIEALQPRVTSRFFPVEYRDHQVMVVRYTKLTEQQLEVGLGAAYSHYRELYPYWRLPLELLRIGKFIHWDSVVCSELVAQFLHYIGAREYLWFGVDPEDLEDEFRHWRDYEIIFEGMLE